MSRELKWSRRAGGEPNASANRSTSTGFTCAPARHAILVLTSRTGNRCLADYR